MAGFKACKCWLEKENAQVPVKNHKFKAGWLSISIQKRSQGILHAKLDLLPEKNFKREKQANR